MKSVEPAQIAFSAISDIPAMVAYWDAEQRCVFSNEAFRDCFGISPTQMHGMFMKDVLGPALYEQNLPHILGVLRGEKQIFQRQIPVVSGQVRESNITYTPDILHGKVRGFTAHCADITPLREREIALEQAIRDRDAALAELRILRGLLPICSFCKSIRDEHNQWQQLEVYVSRHSEATFSHGVCPECSQKHYSQLLNQPQNKPAH
ncbi:MAG TPA: PAS domain-containing protein [Verrucomicrobiae bacterium]|jgi:PAS domain S-box-containing protein